MALEVKNLLGGAEFLTVGYVAGAYAIFTIVGTHIWSIYWRIFTEAGKGLSWMWVATESGLAACAKGTFSSVLR